MTASVVLVGVRGFGANHLRNVRRLAATGVVRLVAAVDPVVAEQVRTGRDPGLADAPLFGSLGAAFDAVGVPDVVIAAVPIPVHVGVATEALRAGADVLLEKPPVARFADFAALLRVEQETGGRVQVGFQSLGSHALRAVLDDAFGIGPVLRVRASGAWVRSEAYWSRSPWAGRRVLDGIDVVDGVTTNPLAHAVATALAIAGRTSADDVGRIEFEAYRANAIDADDTTSLRVTGAGRPRVVAALSLCADPARVTVGPGEDPAPVVEVVGTRGSIRFRYTDDAVDHAGGTARFGRTDLLEDLVAHRRDGTPLVAPLAATGAFMRVMETVRTAPDPLPIAPEHRSVVESGADRLVVVRDVATWVRRATRADALFSEVGAPWAGPAADRVVGRVRIPGVHDEGDALVVAELHDGAALTGTTSPRPYLHPVRTRSGRTLTAVHPQDHDWHLGLGFQIPDVAGTNFWGGNTYVPGRGYELLDDHGRIEVDEVVDEDGLVATLTWFDRDAEPVLRERRTFRGRALGDAWVLEASTVLSALAGPVPLGGPGTNGRVGAGYGGWFWRFPRCTDIDVRTADGAGEADVHGSVAPWLSWSARFDTPNGPAAATVAAAADADTVGDPWFVRTAEYPAFGLASVWDTPVEVAPGAPLRRGFRAVVADGTPDPAVLLGALATVR